MGKRIHLNIGGMTCINCQNKIEHGLKYTEGVTEAAVSFSKGTADIEYDEKRISKDDIPLPQQGGKRNAKRIVLKLLPNHDIMTYHIGIVGKVEPGIES